MISRWSWQCQRSGRKGTDDSAPRTREMRGVGPARAGPLTPPLSRGRNRQDLRMSHTCKNCSRNNPADARYCYFDGAILNGQGSAGPLALGAQPFPHSFVFATGRECQNFDQLALACWNYCPPPVEALKEGDLARFPAALVCATWPRPPAMPPRPRTLSCLAHFLDKLPGSSLQEPKLDAQPGEIALGSVPIGQDRTVKLRLANTGYAPAQRHHHLQGLRLAVPGRRGRRRKKVFQFAQELEIPLHIHGKRLAANAKPQEGHLVIESNGGNVTVPVRIEVPVKPFAAGVAAGAVSLCELAERSAEAAQGDRAALREGHDCGLVQGQRLGLSGAGADLLRLWGHPAILRVLGLARPPKVEVSPEKVVLQGKPGEMLTQSLEVQTQENRMVYGRSARATSPG